AQLFSRIKPSGGFPMHPHRDMEIVTYVIDGELEHRDNQGNSGLIRAGEVQRMTAGAGIVHSEYNASAEQECHLLQMWVIPDEKNLQPGWEQKQFTRKERKDTLLPIISGKGSDNDTLEIHQDATFYISSLSEGKTVNHTANPGRKLYLFVIDGNLRINDRDMAAGDQARADSETEYAFSAVSPAEFLMIDLS
ncbi:pirin family protein, partial [candidate division KSB1 bacterium]